LVTPAIASFIKQELMACELAGYWKVRGAVVMPDHVHMLVRLGCKLVLGNIIARVKSRTRVNSAEPAVRWQCNYYEHRMRPDDPAGDVLRYLYMNPYRAGLLSPGAKYPWFWLGSEEAAWFQPPRAGETTTDPNWLQ
jgi:REP element-mobilizing transposase RayT